MLKFSTVDEVQNAYNKFMVKGHSNKRLEIQTEQHPQ